MQCYYFKMRKPVGRHPSCYTLPTTLHSRKKKYVEGFFSVSTQLMMCVELLLQVWNKVHKHIVFADWLPTAENKRIEPGRKREMKWALGIWFLFYTLPLYVFGILLNYSWKREHKSTHTQCVYEQKCSLHA